MKLSLSAKLYVWLVTFATLSVLAYFVSEITQLRQGLSIPTDDFLWTLLIFSVLAFFAQIYEVELVYKRMTSTAISICLATVLLGGLPLAIAVTLISTLLAELILRWSRLSEGFIDLIWRVAFNTGQFVLSAFAAVLAFKLLGGHPLLLRAERTSESLVFYNQLIPALGAFVTFALVNTSFVSGMLTLFEKTAFTYHLRFNLKHLMVQILSLGVLGILMAVVYAQSPWNLLLVLVPLGLVHVSLRNYMKLRHEAQKTFEHIADLLNERDSYTARHSNETAELAEKIARKLKLHQDEIEKVKSAAIIHDIGKVMVPDHILQKPDSLTEEEWRIMRMHPDIGADLLKELEMYRDIVDVIRHEHEHWDGGGYPKGLKGNEIPIGSRIVAAADIYNALTTDRPYRRAYSHEEALKRMCEMSGVELDPQVVDALLSALEDTQAQSSSPPKKTATA